MQERLNSIANALELRLSCTNPSIYVVLFKDYFKIMAGLPKHLKLHPVITKWGHHKFRYYLMFFQGAIRRLDVRQSPDK